MEQRYCAKCKCSDWLCICDAVDRFFEGCESLKPYDGSPKPKAVIYDFVVFKLTGVRKIL